MAACYGQSFKILCLSAQQWLFCKCLWVNYNGVSMVNKVTIYNGIMKCIYWSHWNLVPILLIRFIEGYHNDHRYSFWVTVLDIRCMITTYSLYISEQYQLDSSTWWHTYRVVMGRVGAECITTTMVCVCACLFVAVHWKPCQKLTRECTLKETGSNQHKCFHKNTYKIDTSAQVYPI